MATTVLATYALIAAPIALLGATWFLSARIHIGEDFSLARRRLSDVFTGLSQAINCLPAWLLMALALFAYSMGLAAVWMAATIALGLVINWWWIAPRLRAQTMTTGSITLAHWFAFSAGDNLQAATRRSATAIVVFCTSLTSVTLLQWVAQNVAARFDTTTTTANILVVATLLLATVPAGLWSASVADLIQAAVLSIVLPVFAVCALSTVGGWQSLWLAIDMRESVTGPWFGGYSGVLAVAMLVGVFFASLGGAAQPQVIARYLACRDDATLRRARAMAMSWSSVMLLVALLVGWCARVLLNNVDHSWVLFILLTNRTAGAGLSSLLVAGLSIVFALACASPWVAVATHLAMDLRAAKQPLSLAWCRVTLIAFGILICWAVFYMPAGSEDRLWLCWNSLSAAFGPLLLVRLTGKKVRPGSLLGAMWSGFVLTILFHLMPDTPGDLLERSLPFIVAMGIALSGGDQRRNPNRADRGDKTVHDHLPI
jgi:sodium/proline symporter